MLSNIKDNITETFALNSDIESIIFMTSFCISFNSVTFLLLTSSFSNNNWFIYCSLLLNVTIFDCFEFSICSIWFFIKSISFITFDDSKSIVLWSSLSPSLQIEYSFSMLFNSFFWCSIITFNCFSSLYFFIAYTYIKFQFFLAQFIWLIS